MAQHFCLIKSRSSLLVHQPPAHDPAGHLGYATWDSGFHFYITSAVTHFIETKMLKNFFEFYAKQIADSLSKFQVKINKWLKKMFNKIKSNNIFKKNKN